MTQEFNTPYAGYVGDGSTMQFPYPWMIANPVDMEVYLHDILTTAYSLTNIGVPTGGHVVFFQPPPSGQRVFLRRITPQTQMTDYISNDPFDAQAHEAALDKLTREIQDFGELLSRMVRLPLSIANNLRNLLLPLPIPGKLLGWSADGTQLTLYDQALTTVAVTPGSGEVHGVTTRNVVSVGGASFLTAAALIPAGTVLAGIGYRVSQSFSVENGLTSVHCGGMGVENRWGASLGITAGSVNNCGQWVGAHVPIRTAQDVILLANPAGARFGTLGQIVLTAFWTRYNPL